MLSKFSNLDIVSKCDCIDLKRRLLSYSEMSIDYISNDKNDFQSKIDINYCP